MLIAQPIGGFMVTLSVPIERVTCYLLPISVRTVVYITYSFITPHQLIKYKIISYFHLKYSFVIKYINIDMNKM